MYILQRERKKKKQKTKIKFFFFCSYCCCLLTPSPPCCPCFRICFDYSLLFLIMWVTKVTSSFWFLFWSWSSRTQAKNILITLRPRMYLLENLFPPSLIGFFFFFSFAYPHWWVMLQRWWRLESFPPPFKLVHSFVPPHKHTKKTKKKEWVIGYPCSSCSIYYTSFSVLGRSFFFSYRKKNIRIKAEN